MSLVHVGGPAQPVVIYDAAGNIISSFNGGNVAVSSPLGRSADAASVSVALSTEDVAILSRLPAAAALADGVANPTVPTIGVDTALFNGATWDRQTGNVDGTALASAVRAAQINSADLVNYNCRGVIVFLNVTAASGTGGLTLRIQAKDPISGAYGNLLSASAAVVATGMSIYLLYPGGASGGTQGVTGPLPRTWRISMNVGDASNYTYSVGYSLVR